MRLQHARLNARAEGTLQEILDAIEAARTQGNVSLEAEGWDLLGEERLSRHDLSGAESALEQGYRLRSLHLQRDLRLSYWRLGALRLAQNRLKEASRFTSVAIDMMKVEGAALSGRTLLHQRGLINQAQGRTDLALVDFEAASRSAESLASGRSTTVAFVARRPPTRKRIGKCFVPSSRPQPVRR